MLIGTVRNPDNLSLSSIHIHEGRIVTEEPLRIVFQNTRTDVVSVGVATVQEAAGCETRGKVRTEIGLACHVSDIAERNIH